TRSKRDWSSDVCSSDLMTAPNHLLTSAGGNQHPSAFADLDGKRFVAISEPNRGRLDEALVKWLTGGDGIRARHMHCDSYEFAPRSEERREGQGGESRWS